MLGLYLEQNRDRLEEIFLELVPPDRSNHRLFVLALYREVLADYMQSTDDQPSQLFDNELMLIGKTLEDKLGFASSLNMELTNGDYIEIAKSALPPRNIIN
jgi:hypothetical protein